MPTEIEASYRVVTPMFCAGADPGRAELRLPSFKGVLRFWWRALAWSRLDGNLNTIRTIQEQEDCLFGSAGGGQSRVSMRMGPSTEPPEPIPVEQVLQGPGTNRAVGQGARYLGYGVMESFDGRNTTAGRLTRACVPAPFEFTVQLRGRDLDKPKLQSLKTALITLGTLGGIGAKSRKGYGSLVLQSLSINGDNEWEQPHTKDDLRTKIASLQEGTAALPEFTALSKETRCLLVSSATTEPLESLDLIGRELMRYRSWGHEGKVLGQPSEPNFKDDHDLMKNNRRNRHPRRIAFGLPHNYRRSRDQQVGPADQHLDRRASPLFIHIHEYGGNPVAVLSFLPARFLPCGKSDISVGGSRVRQKPEADLYRPIHDFLDRLLDPKKRKEPFTDVVEVRP